MDDRDLAKAAVADPSNPTAVLDALAKQLTGDAQSGLAKFRSDVGDPRAMQAIESTSSKGLDLKNFLTGKGMSDGAMKAATAENRARVLQAEALVPKSIGEAFRAGRMTNAGPARPTA